MELSKLPLGLKEALACHKLFSNLGFSSDQIRLICYEDGSLIVSLEVNDSEFTIDVGSVCINPILVKEIWKEAAEEFNKQDYEADQIYNNSSVKNNVDLVKKLLRQKGIISKAELN